ncbi:MAG: hypothetical protein HY809_09280 [Nitrospirae bacterium]|nr:hypothetical protein [Nitrospirota bacterium]
MLRAPERYLETIISDAKIEKDLSAVISHFISRSSNNLHLIIDENEIESADIICHLSRKIKKQLNTDFNFREGQKIINLKSLQHGVFSILSLNPHKLSNCENLNTTWQPSTLNDFIPLTNADIQQVGTIKKRFLEFKELFGSSSQSDFYSNEKLLVIGNLNLFNQIPHSYPACFSFTNEDGEIEIKYNSPLLPKISVLKNINILERYIDKEINGEHITFNVCLFVGSSKFKHSINIIRNHYNQKRFERIIFIGEKDVKINLGNNQIPLRWKWTVPEINYFNNRQFIEHKFLTIPNSELYNTTTQLYKLINDIEARHTVFLKPLFRFVRRLYYDWTLKPESNKERVVQIKEDYNLALNELLEETFFNIDPAFNFQKYYQILSSKFTEIIDSVRTNNNKTEIIKSYQHKIHQLVVPSFLCNSYKSQLNQIYNESKKHAPTVKSLNSLGNLKEMKQYWDDTNRNYFSLTAARTKTEIVSFAKSDNANKQYYRIVASIYGSGKIEKIIERLLRAKTEYNLLLYSIEEEAFKFHIDRYVEELNREYASNDRYEICGIEFNDNYYQFSTFDTLIEALASTQQDDKDTEYYKITFSDNSTVKLPSSKSVLKVSNTEKIVVRVEELCNGDEVQIYENPDKEALRTIFKLEHPDLISKADEYSALWQQCLIDYSNEIIFEQQLYNQLVSNGFSVSINTMRRYLQNEATFPRRRIDLIAIAKTVNDSRLSFNFVRNTILPFIHDYNGKMIEYGFRLSESINHFLTTEEIDAFISDWYNRSEVEKIASQIPIKKVKDFELLTTRSNVDD